MITTTTDTWATPRDVIKVGTKTIKGVYVKPGRLDTAEVYPIYTPTQAILRAASIGGKTYFCPASMKYADAKADGYLSLSPFGHTAIKTEKTHNDAAGITCYKGAYLVEKDVRIEALTYTRKGTKSETSKTYTLTYGETGTENTLLIPAIGTTTLGILLPTADRYMITGGWIKDGYEDAVPVLFSGYAENKNGQVFSLPSKNNSGANYQTFLGAGAYLVRDVYAAQDLTGINGIAVGTAIAASNPLSGYGQWNTVTDIDATTGGYYGAASSFSRTYGPTPLGISIGIGQTSGYIGSCVTWSRATNNGKPIWTGQSVIADPSIRCSAIFTDIKDSAGNIVGGFAYSFDHVITGITTQEDFAWYTGTLS